VRFISEFFENIRIALEQLRAHKMRAFLTMLGVAIGVLAITLMGTAINGIDRGFNNSMDMLGTENFFVERMPWGNNAHLEWWKYRGRPHLKSEYAEQLNEIIANTPNSVLEVATPGAVGWTTFKNGDKRIEGVYTYGTSAKFPQVNTAEIAAGRFFTETEEANGSAVAVLGYDVADALFEDGNAIGKTVMSNGRRVRVIGVFEKQGSFLGMMSFDTNAIVPMKWLRSFQRRNRDNDIRVRMVAGADKEQAMYELEGAMRRVRGLEPGEENDFAINATEALEDDIGKVKSMLAIAGMIITSLALFVGAIGIMNITFVSVKERTREIGTRRALGARRSSILTQFLVEAVVVCLFGGLMGLITAYLLKLLLGVAIPAFPFIYSTSLIVFGLAVSVFIGIASGFIPAVQAAFLNPTTALRHE